jgi:ABC-type antimicrobial peptide transport system permease subunit
MVDDKDPLANQKKACDTYVEQTKLLFTLASAFIIGPAILELLGKTDYPSLFILCEICFVLSAVMGYVVLGTIAGSQNDGSHDVFRPATMGFSITQFGLYLAGIILFVIMISHGQSTQIIETKCCPCCHCS